ncbi:PREDICTED: cysteine-rich receptor-like protein kinase 5 isoform X1 [Camelina sativa]|uniref:Cysteine-rich receptor-like protein kinase 5 isoform X1 n=1 Tax=Camelina sativa TaxID=90675 RepID=A0ABM0UCP2_CAMSA|nr:PREDICTED: cysteine-rich receptor-like protein kinase 5 isoform X1 [Camelina sativa]
MAKCWKMSACGFLFILTFLTSMRPSTQQPKPVGSHCPPGRHTYLKNSTYFSNLKTLLFSLSSEDNHSSSNGFLRLSKGLKRDMVYGLYLCRGDLLPEVCRDCVNFAVKDILRQCPNEREALIYYDECMLRYTDRDTLLDPVATPGILIMNQQNITVNESEQFNDELLSLINETSKEAADSSRKFAVNKGKFTSSENIYVMVQCMPDLTRENCSSCLQETIRKLPRDKTGGRLLWPSCTLRYELYPFYNKTLPRYEQSERLSQAPTPSQSARSSQAPPPPTPPQSERSSQAPPSPQSVLSSQAPPPPPQSGKNGNSIVIIIAIVVPLAVYILLFAVISSFHVINRVKKAYETAAADDDGDDITTAGSLQFDFNAVEAATDKFSESNKLGQGGFGQVYKGTFPNGLQVAVKRLSKTSGQGEQEFKNEVLVVAKLQHKNLVKLLGFCLEREEKILVYEFVPNKGLDYFLFDSTLKIQLEWTRRYEIIKGIARGVLYLHQDSRLTIIHRDLKASNILLDDDMNPKVADFGMARIFGIDQTEANTKRVVGTYGYMSPEYAMYGQFSMKSDVYSFGVLVLEIISGRKNNSLYQMKDSAGNLVTYTWRLWNNGSPIELVDPSFQENYQVDDITRCIHIALLCVQEEAEDRPTMSEINQMLTTSSIPLAIPQPPGFFLRRKHEQVGSSGAGPSTGSSVLCSIDDVSITQVTPR